MELEEEGAGGEDEEEALLKFGSALRVDGSEEDDLGPSATGDELEAK